MDTTSRLRGDAAFASADSNFLVRHGDEETTLIEGARTVDEARAELIARGLLVRGAVESDWQSILTGKGMTAKVAFAAGPDEFRRALEEHGILGSASAAAVQLFIEVGVDVPGRSAFNEVMWKRRMPWLWLQIPSLFEIRWCAFVPGETACAHCLETRLLNNRRNAREYLAVLAANSGKLPAARMPAVWQVACGLAVMESARLAAGVPASAVGRLSSMELGNFKTESERVLPVPRCEICAD